MAQKKKEDLDSLKKRIADQVSDLFKQGGWTNPDRLARSWSEEVKKQAFKNISALMGVKIAWDEISFEKDSEFWILAREAARPFAQKIFLDLQPKMAEVIAKKLPKINKTVLSLVTGYIDEYLDELARLYVKNEMDELIKAEAHRVAEAWFAESMATLDERKVDEAAPLDEEV